MQEVAQRHRRMSDDEWAGTLKLSVTQREIDGVRFPAFPADAIQSQFVGSANHSTIDEALNFYKTFKGFASEVGAPIDYDTSAILDFGCGWGRYLRFFWRDVHPKNLFGVDIDPTILAQCKKDGVPGDLRGIEPRGQLPFPDNHFTHMFAYSVFTHLPEDVQLHWLSELSRVAKPGCVFICTTEPRRFLDFVADIPDPAPSGWHEGLKKAAGDIDAAKAKFDAGEFVYLPTGGGDFRAADVYGDAVIPLAYIRKKWDEYFSFRDYIDDPARFWQAVYVGQKS